MTNQFCFHIPHVATLSVSTNLPLPAFVGDLARPAYVDTTVVAILNDGTLPTGEFRYLILLRWIGAASEYRMQQWAEAYAREIEKESHELASLECDYLG